jgi:hypothetical protein
MTRQTGIVRSRGVTPKSLPAPSSRALPNEEEFARCTELANRCSRHLMPLMLLMKCQFRRCLVPITGPGCALAGVCRSCLGRAKAQGKKLGPPRRDTPNLTAIRKPRKRGIGINKIASKLGVGVSVVQRVLSDNP